MASDDQVFDASENQVLFEPVTNFNKAQSERLRQEQMRLENERIRLEIERSKREVRRQEEKGQAEAVKQQKRDHQSDGPDLYEKLIKLGQLRDDNVLTEEEFQELKKRILAEHDW